MPEPEPMPQAQPNPEPPHVDVHIDLGGLADLIWRSFQEHIGDVIDAVFAVVAGKLREIEQAIWDAVWHSTANILTQIPADLTYNLRAYQAIVANPVPLAIGGATLALVLLGLRTIAGAFVGRDHAVTHILTRLIPAVFLVLAYPTLIVRGIELVNATAEGLGSRAILDGLRSGPPIRPFSPEMATIPLYALLWLLLIYYGIRLLIRLVYSLFRLVVALVFGPVALILWAIPQTEWVTWFWLRELVGWATTPLLVTACLAIAMPIASGRDGVIPAFLFGIAGFQAAYDLVGLLAHAPRANNLLRWMAREGEEGMRLGGQYRAAAAGSSSAIAWPTAIGAIAVRAAMSQPNNKSNNHYGHK